MEINRKTKTMKPQKNMDLYDIIIIGSGMAGLYSAYKIKQYAPKTSFLILEQYKKEWVGGRASNEMFYGTRVVTGAGIGRLDKNPLLIHLMKQLKIKYKPYESIMDYSQTVQHPVDLVKIIKFLKKEYKNHPDSRNLTFSQFFKKFLGPELYEDFRISAGYTDYENADTKETLYNYGMDDNQTGWTALSIPWREMVLTLCDKIGWEHFRFSQKVTKIEKISDSSSFSSKSHSCIFQIETEKGEKYYTNRVILATTITSIHRLVPGASNKNSIYQQIHGQPFLRLYGKFDKKSALIMNEYVKHYTKVPGPLQKIIPMNAEKGVYMIAYSDNANALALKPYLENTEENRTIFSRLLEKALGIPSNSLYLIAIKDFYWPIGTHYFEPLCINNARGNRCEPLPLGKDTTFRNRDEFLKAIQHPEDGFLVVGEAVSRYQGWTEGALESVEAVVTKDWVGGRTSPLQPPPC
jgi:hypothetical protein